MSTTDLDPEERHHLRYLRDLHFKEQKGLCYYCKVPMTPPDVPEPKPDTTLTLEHLKRRADGGGSNYLNTAAACLGCNQKYSKRVRRGESHVPSIVIQRKPKQFQHYTYTYTTPSKPGVLVLYNSKSTRDTAMLEMRQLEGEPINLKDWASVLA